MNDQNDRWAAVGSAIKQRMADLNMSQAELARRAQVSVPLIKGLMDGTPRGETSETKRRAVCRALGWTDDSIDRILDGEAPTVVRAYGGGNLSAADEAAIARIVAQPDLPDVSFSMKSGGINQSGPAAVAALFRIIMRNEEVGIEEASRVVSILVPILEELVTQRARGDEMQARVEELEQQVATLQDARLEDLQQDAETAKPRRRGASDAEPRAAGSRRRPPAS